MALQFKNPWLLLLLIPAAAYMIFTIKRMIRLVKWRKISVITLRSLVFIIVIMLLSGISFTRVSNRSTTLFVVDSSDSMLDKNEASLFIKSALKEMGRYDEAGIVNFGENTAIEVLPTKKPIFDEIQTKINPSFTNIEKALLMAQSLMPWDHKKRLVLITDGRENSGDVIKQVKQMRTKGYVIDVYPSYQQIDKEVQLDEIKVPESVHLNEQFKIEVTVKSNIETQAVLSMYSDRTITVQKKVVLNKGVNKFAFSDKAVNGGMSSYRVEIQADMDTLSQNNSMSSFTYVKDKPKILIIQEYEEAGRQLKKILEKDMDVTVLNAEQIPAEMSEMLKYDAFVLSNVSAESLNSKFLENLEIVVNHQGKGLLVTGGDRSFGPGGYYKTPLEKILPVNMDVKPKEEEPNLALLLVIDKSGSMSSSDYGISKMELATEAAIRATEVLNENDMIGVIAFDDALKWVVKPQSIDDLKAVQDAIGTIRAGGGTQILPPLEEAYNSIKELDTKLKHIILLTDGQAEKEGYESVIEGLRENGITLSTVGVGRGADHMLMKALAYGGMGRYYQTDEFSDIPSIFTKEVFLAGKKYLTNRVFSPELYSNSEILNGIDKVPQLEGYVATAPKDTANIIFVSDEGEPVLASWQYGLGRTVAWTSDAQGMWTYDWMRWENSPKFWKNIISWIVQQDLSKGYTIESKIEGQEGIITVKADKKDEFMTANDIRGNLVGPDGDIQEIKLIPYAPGEYRGSFKGDKSGLYIADITLSGAEGSVERISSGMVIPYSKEYDLIGQSNNELIKKIAYEGGGRVLENPAQVFRGELPLAEGVIDVSRPLFIALLILFLMDTALRRLNIGFGMWDKKLNNLIDKGEITKITKGTKSAESIESTEKKESTASGSIAELLEQKRKWNK